MCRICEAVMVSSLDRLGASPTEKKGPRLQNGTPFTPLTWEFIH